MKKKIRLTIIISVILVILTVVTIVVLSIPPASDGGVSVSSKDILLYDKTSLIPEQITIENKSGKFDFVGVDYTKEASEASLTEKDEDDSSQNIRTETGFTPDDINMIYTMQEFPDTRLDTGYTNLLAYQCMYITAIQLVDKSGKKYAEYGLDKPQSTVSILFSDDSKETIYIGNMAPENKGLYFRVDGNSNVYLGLSDSMSMFLEEKMQFFAKGLTSGMSEDDDIYSIAVSGDGYKDDIFITKEQSVSSISTFQMTSPYREVCSLSVPGGFGELFFGMKGDKVDAVQVGEKEIAEYGLDKPWMNIIVTSEMGQTVHLLVSKADEDGNCHVMADGGSTICTILAERCESWYGLDYRKFLSANLLMPDLEHMSGVSVKASGNTDEYEVHTEIVQNDFLEDVVQKSVKIGEKEISYSSFASYIKNVSDLERIDMPEKGLEGADEVYSISMTFTDGDKNLTDTLKLYETSDSRFIVTLNDQLEGYIKNAEYVTEIISDSANLREGKEIKVIQVSSSEESTSDESFEKLPEMSDASEAAASE